MHDLGLGPLPARTSMPVDLRDEIACLPDRERLVLSLFYFERLQLDQIAAVLEESEDDVAATFYWAHVGVGADSLTPATAAAA